MQIVQNFPAFEMFFPKDGKVKRGTNSQTSSRIDLQQKMVRKHFSAALAAPRLIKLTDAESSTTTHARSQMKSNMWTLPNTLHT